MAESPATPPYQLISLTETSFEYKEVWGTVMRTASQDLAHFLNNPFRIIDIKRIQNVYLWEQFCLKRTAEMRSGTSTWVRELFHGIKGGNIDAICRGDLEGKKTGSAHSSNETTKVVPFSPYFWYARRFPRKNLKAVRTMLMCDVLVYDQRDKCVSDVVINTHEDNEFYPKYVIEYSLQRP